MVKKKLSLYISAKVVYFRPVLIANDRNSSTSSLKKKR